MIPYPIDMTSPVWLLILFFTAYNESIQVNTSDKCLVPITRLYPIIFLTHTEPLFRFFESSSSLLDTWILIKDNNVYRSKCFHLTRYNNLEVTEWKIYLFYSSIFSSSSSIVKGWCCSREDTIPLISSPNFTITASKYVFMYISILFYFVIYMFIPIK